MTTQAIQVGGTAVDPSARRSRAPSAVESTLQKTIRLAVVAVFLVVALCGMAATASWAVAGTTPPDGPQVGLDR
jgi:hypothetical protein